MLRQQDARALEARSVTQRQRRNGAGSLPVTSWRVGDAAGEFHDWVPIHTRTHLVVNAGRGKVIEQTHQHRFRRAAIIVALLVVVSGGQREVNPEKRPVNVDGPVYQMGRIGHRRHVVDIVRRMGVVVAMMWPDMLIVCPVVVACVGAPVMAVSQP